jgi:hypothetical protein
MGEVIGPSRVVARQDLCVQERGFSRIVVLGSLEQHSESAKFHGALGVGRALTRKDGSQRFVLLFNLFLDRCVHASEIRKGNPAQWRGRRGRTPTRGAKDDGENDPVETQCS